MYWTILWQIIKKCDSAKISTFLGNTIYLKISFNKTFDLMIHNTLFFFYCEVYPFLVPYSLSDNITNKFADYLWTFCILQLH